MPRFRDALGDSRCRYGIRLRDGSGAQCGKMHNFAGPFCTQHDRMVKRQRASMSCCGGNDAGPVEHTQDCQAREEARS